MAEGQILLYKVLDSMCNTNVLLRTYACWDPSWLSYLCRASAMGMFLNSEGMIVKIVALWYWNYLVWSIGGAKASGCSSKETSRAWCKRSCCKQGRSRLLAEEDRHQKLSARSRSKTKKKTVARSGLYAITALPNLIAYQSKCIKSLRLCVGCHLGGLSWAQHL